MVLTSSHEVLVTLASMTGYAQAEVQAGALAWSWELKSVNGRVLDIRCRLPSGWDSVEHRVRTALASHFSRGNIVANLKLVREPGVVGISVNRLLLDQLLSLAREYEGREGVEPPRLDSLLATRGVVEVGEADDDNNERKVREEAILATLNEAILYLIDARMAEGEQLFKVLASQLDEIERLIQSASRNAATQPAGIKAQLELKLSELLENVPAFTDGRLDQEVALLVVKADVREELDRLAAHIVQVRELLISNKSVGRRLDFIAQEFNREANTLCSKSSDVTLTRIGLDLKVAIEKFREQSQNIE